MCYFLVLMGGSRRKVSLKNGRVFGHNSSKAVSRLLQYLCIHWRHSLGKNACCYAVSVSKTKDIELQLFCLQVSNYHKQQGEKPTFLISSFYIYIYIYISFSSAVYMWLHVVYESKYICQVMNLGISCWY